jgi:FkbM family methyltransferase
LALYDEIFKHNIYGKTLVNVKDDDIIFDIGANIGLFSLWVQSFYGNPLVKYYCFEPAPELMTCLCKNIKSPMEPFMMAISDVDRSMMFKYYPRLPELSTIATDQSADIAEQRDWSNFLKNRYRWLRFVPGNRFIIEAVKKWLFKPETSLVQVHRLDTIIDRMEGLNYLEKSQRISLIKIDVEKSEIDVLNGIGKHWDRIDQIIVETFNHQGYVNKVINILDANGFVVKKIDNTMFPELRTPLVVGVRDKFVRY